MTYYDELIKSDWLGRNIEDYTAKVGKSLNGWENSLSSGSALSTYILKIGKHCESLPLEWQVNIVRSLCLKIYSRISITNEPINISLTSEFDNYNNGKSVVVTIEPLTDMVNYPSINHRIDPVLGFFIHEALHSIYTTEEYDNAINTYTGIDQKVFGTIMNIIEDERIEQRLSRVHRGYTGYIGKAKDYCFDKKFNEALASKAQKEELPEIAEVFNNIIRFVRYPRALDKDLVNSKEKLFRRVQEILTPYPDTIAGVISCSEKILALLQDEFKAEFNKARDNQQNSQQDRQDSGNGNKGESGAAFGSSADGQSDSSDEPDSGGSCSGSISASGASSGGSASGSNGSDSDSTDDKGSGCGDNANDKNSGNNSAAGTGNDDKDDSGADDNTSGGNSGSQDDNSKTLEEALSTVITALSEATATPSDMGKLLTKLKVSSSTASALLTMATSSTEDIATRTNPSHQFPTTETIQAASIEVKLVDNSKEISINSANKYAEALSKVSSFSSSLRAKIQQLNRNHTVNLTGLYEGDFDDSLLVDAIVGAKNIYSESHKIVNKGATIVLLLDESGSMHTDMRYVKAREIAVMFERALAGVNNIDYFCYGHTTDRSNSYTNPTKLNIYFEGRKKGDPRALGAINYENMNRDGHALVEVISRVRAQVKPDSHIILFMLTDGEPSASVPAGYNGVTYTKACVDFVEKRLNSTVIHIAIDKGIPSNMMFNHFVTFTDYNKLVSDIGGLLRTIISKLQKPIEI